MSSQTTQTLIQLREMILNGQLGVGERLREAHLAKQLGTSRTPIRAALARLSEEGLLEALEPVGYAVRAFTLRDVEEAIEMRGMIEGMAVRLAAERGAEPSALQTLGGIVDTLDAVLQTDDALSDAHIDRYFELNHRFHCHLRLLVDSFVIDHMFDRIVALPFASPNAFVMAQSELGNSRAVLKMGNAQHRALVAAIANRQGMRAESLAREHAQLTLSTLARAIRQNGGIEQIRNMQPFGPNVRHNEPPNLLEAR